MELILENRKNLFSNKLKLIFQIILCLLFFSILLSCKKKEQIDVWISPFDGFISVRTGELVFFKNNKICFAHTKYYPNFSCFTYSFSTDSNLLYINDTIKHVAILPDTLFEIIENSENKMIWKYNRHHGSSVWPDTIKFTKLKPNIHSVNKKKILKRLLNSSWSVEKDGLLYSSIRFTNKIIPPFPPKSFGCFSVVYQESLQNDCFCAEIETWNIQKIEKNVFLNIQNIGQYNTVFHIVSFKNDTIRANVYGMDSIINIKFISLPTYEDYPENM